MKIGGEFSAIVNATPYVATTRNAFHATQKNARDAPTILYTAQNRIAKKSTEAWRIFIIHHARAIICTRTLHDIRIHTQTISAIYTDWEWGTLCRPQNLHPSAAARITFFALHSFWRQVMAPFRLIGPSAQKVPKKRLKLYVVL